MLQGFGTELCAAGHLLFSPETPQLSSGPGRRKGGGGPVAGAVELWADDSIEAGRWR